MNQTDNYVNLPLCVLQDPNYVPNFLLKEDYVVHSL